jgi:hypothetical protein
MSRRPGGRLVAAATTAIVLAACEPDPGVTTFVPEALPSAGRSFLPAIIGTPIPTATPFVPTPIPGVGTPEPGQPTPAPGATPTPPLDVPPPGYPGVMRLRGRILDEGGMPVGGAFVQVRSLDTEVVYDRTITAEPDGSYRLEDVPSHLNVEVAVRREGFTARRRVVALVPAPLGELVDFGAPMGVSTGSDLSPGAPYFLSNRPEIADVSPAEDDDALEPGREITFTLTLSEALDDVNRARFADCLRLLPASTGALPKGLKDGARDLREVGGDVDVDGGEMAWAIGVGARVGDDGPEATVSWPGDRVARFRVPASLVTSAAGDVRYQVALVSPEDGARIEDALFHQLGTDAADDLNGYPAPGRLIHNVFRDPDLLEAWSDARVGDAPQARWAATHRHAAVTSVAQDTRPPVLTAVDAGRVGDDGALTLVFDEPMAAWDGTASGRLGAGLDASGDGLLAVTFALGASATAVAAVTLDGDPAGAEGFVDARSETVLGARWFGRELAFDPATGVRTRTGAPPGTVVFAADPLDPRRVRLLVVGRPFFFQDVRAIRVRAEGFGDPAGNLRAATRADAEIRTKTFPTPRP